MGFMHGNEATRRIRAMGVTDRVTKIIGLTGDAMAENLKEYLNSGLTEARAHRADRRGDSSSSEMPPRQQFR